MYAMATEDDPVTLDNVARTLFKGAVSAAVLRSEAERGHLAIFKIGRRHFTTMRSAREMLERCRVEPKAVTCAHRGTVARSSRPSMPLVTDGARAAVDALRQPRAKAAQ
jgi:hypothetical protein